MSKLLVVFGATGQQGGSVVDYVLNDQELASQFKIRAITRSASGSAAKALQERGVEIVQADPEQPDTLKAACQGAHTVFSNTVTGYDAGLYDREVSTGKGIADASVAAGAEYIIYSSSTPGGKFTGRPVKVFDCKYEVEEYIRTLPIKSAFYAAGTFMQNYHGSQAPKPTETPGEYAIYSIIDAKQQLPLIEVVADTGKYVGAILAELDKYAGKTFYAASEMLTGEDIARLQGEASGKKVKYVQLPEEVFKKFLPEPMQELLCSMMAYMDKPGYYGPDTKERVAWTQAQVRGELTTYAEFLKKNPPKLE